MCIIHKLGKDRGSNHGHLSLDGTGSHYVDRDAFGTQLLSQRHRHGAHRAFGSAINCQPFVAQLTDDGANVDDAASFIHVWQGCLDQQEWRPDVYVMDVIPRLECYSGDTLVDRPRPGVVGDDVNLVSVERFHRLRDEHRTEVRSGCICFDSDRLDTETLDLGYNFLCGRCR